MGDLSAIAAGNNAIDCITGDIRITAGNLKLPNTNAGGTQGIISFAGTRFISNYGTNNTFVGSASGNSSLTVANAIENTAVGRAALASLVGTGANQGRNNVAVGSGSLQDITNSSYCVAVGTNAGNNLLSGNFNILIGDNSGINYTSNESLNIIIGHGGIAFESNTIRIGGV